MVKNVLMSLVVCCVILFPVFKNGLKGTVKKKTRRQQAQRIKPPAVRKLGTQVYRLQQNSSVHRKAVK